MLGYTLHMAGRLDEALPMHLKAAEFQEMAPVATYNVACVHSLKGDKDKAFEWLEKAVALGFGNAEQLAGDTDFDNIRNDPRFTKIAESVQTRVQAFVATTARKSSRLAYFGAKGSPGQVVVDYGPVAWKSNYDQQIDEPKLVGRKWRLGSDYWTTLDNSVSLQLGGVEIPAGYWFLTLTNKGERKFVLTVHDAANAKEQRIDPFRAERLTGGVEVPLKYQSSEKTAANLEIAIRMLAGDRTKGGLQIRFGGHELSAELQVLLPQ
jgi:hypothetical protein